MTLRKFRGCGIAKNKAGIGDNCVDLSTTLSTNDWWQQVTTKSFIEDMFKKDICRMLVSY
jgi:hypothetical protein